MKLSNGNQISFSHMCTYVVVFFKVLISAHYEHIILKSRNFCEKFFYFVVYPLHVLSEFEQKSECYSISGQFLQPTIIFALHIKNNDH